MMMIPCSFAQIVRTFAEAIAMKKIVCYFVGRRR